ncbi:MFS transporter [Vogesella sp. LIG4]|uniref:MFS transporter n=1 Tax=Vogesella sp. LIG4 TaxID=1192162 RepID=UPI00081FAE0E|nr:MFS transporter [Vogesella sp. LIG4]SCK24829.1 Cyanate permease [Vogesella sp. LIG4]
MTTQSVSGWRSIARSIAALMTGYLVLMAANNMLTSLTSLQLVAHGARDALSGLVQSAYYLGFVCGALFARDLIMRIGHHRAFVGIVALIVAVVLLQSLAFHPLLWIACRMFTGMSLLGVFMIVESWLNDAAPSAQRGRVIALYMITSYLGAGAGQAVLLLVPASSPAAFPVVMAIFACAALPVWLGSARRSGHVAHRRTLRASVGQLWRSFRLIARQTPAAMIAIVVAGMLNSAYYTLMPVFLSHSGYGETAVVRDMAWSMLAALLLQWPLGALADRYGRVLVLQRLCLAAAALAGSIYLLLGQWQMIWLVFCYVSVVFGMYGIANVIVNDTVAPALRVETSSVLLLTFAAGGVVGPVLVSAVMTWAGAAAYFLCLMLLCLVFPLASLLLRGAAGEVASESV